MRIDHRHTRDVQAHEEYTPALVLWECMPRACRGQWLIETIGIELETARSMNSIARWWLLAQPMRSKIVTVLSAINTQCRDIDHALYSRTTARHAIPEREMTSDAIATEYAPAFIVWERLQSKERREFLLLAGCTTHDVQHYMLLSWPLIPFHVRLRLLRAMYDWAQFLLQASIAGLA